MKSSVKFGAIALASVLVLAGCAGGGDDAADTDTSGSDLSAVAEGLGGEEAAAQFQEMYDAAIEAGQTTVNLYTPLTATSEALFTAFEERFPGITIEPLQIVGAELTTKIMQEKSSGQRIADVVITGDSGAVGLANQDAFVEYRPFNAGEVTDDPQMSLPTGTLTAISESPRVLFYDTRVEMDIPASWEDLLDPQYKGKITMTNPATDGGGLQWGDLVLNTPELGEDYLRELAAQDIIIAPSTAECHNYVVQGRAALCVMGGIGNYLAMQNEGAPVDIVYPIEGGNWTTVWYAGIIEEAPNQLAAELLVTWLNTPEANDVMATVGHGPVANGENTEFAFPKMSEVDLFDRPALDDVIVRQSEESQPMLLSIFGS